MEYLWKVFCSPQYDQENVSGDGSYEISDFFTPHIYTVLFRPINPY